MTDHNEALKAMDEIFLTICHTTTYPSGEDRQQGRITLEQYETIRRALTPSPDAEGEQIPEWLSSLDYQRDLALIWMAAKQSKDYDESVGDKIERVQSLILAQKKALAKPARDAGVDVEIIKLLGNIKSGLIFINVSFHDLPAKELIFLCDKALSLLAPEKKEGE
jgi:hypothetical protein